MLTDNPDLCKIIVFPEISNHCVVRLTIDVGERQAYLDYNFAPLKLRRDIGMLGVILKICYGSAHPDFEALFPKLPGQTSHGHDTRVARRRHDLQLVGRCDGSQLCPFQRSLFG